MKRLVLILIMLALPLCAAEPVLTYDLHFPLEDGWQKVIFLEDKKPIFTVCVQVSADKPLQYWLELYTRIYANTMKLYGNYDDWVFPNLDKCQITML